MKNLNLEVTIEEAELIISSLQAQPFNRVNVIIQNLVQQCNEQLKPKRDVVVGSEFLTPLNEQPNVKDIPGFERTMEELKEL